MSYRPTISVYIRGEIADIGYYRNWSDRALFMEAAAIMAVFGHCQTVPEYRRRKAALSGAEALPSDDKEVLLSLERWSEFPVLVDLTRKNIYVSCGALSPRELSRIPTVGQNGLCRLYRGGMAARQRDPFRSGYVCQTTDFHSLLRDFRIPFDAEQCDSLRDVFATDPKLLSYLSDDTRGSLKKLA